MNGPISTLPLGLLGLLGIKNEGEYPKELARIVSPTLDMMQFLQINAYEELVDTVAAATDGIGLLVFASGVLTVPNGQVWLVRGAQISADIGAAEATTYRMVVANTTGGCPFKHGEVVGQYTGAGTAFARSSSCRSVIDGPFLMRPQDRPLVAAQTVLSAATITYSCRLSILRFLL